MSGFWQIINEGIDPSTPVADLPGNLPASRVTGHKRGAVFLPRTTTYPLTHVPVEFPQFRKKIFTPDAGLIMCTFQIDTQHNGVNGHAVQIEGNLMVRSAASEPELTSATFVDLPNSYDEGIIRDVTHHYYTIHTPRYPHAVLPNTWHEFTLKLGAKSTVSGTLDGLASVQSNGGTQLMLLEYEPGAYLL